MVIVQQVVQLGSSMSTVDSLRMENLSLSAMFGACRLFTSTGIDGVAFRISSLYCSLFRMCLCPAFAIFVSSICLISFIDYLYHDTRYQEWTGLGCGADFEQDSGGLFENTWPEFLIEEHVNWIDLQNIYPDIYVTKK